MVNKDKKKLKLIASCVRLIIFWILVINLDQDQKD